MNTDVALVTYSGLSGLAEDERLLVDALTKKGLRVVPVVWDDPQVDWADISVCVIRSTWDYHHRLDEFLGWVARVDQLTTLWNPANAVRWNTCKTYLRDLSERGIPTVPTLWVTRDSTVSLYKLMAEQGWHKVVVKPVVSASAYGTLLVTEDDAAAGQSNLDAMLAERDMMVQPFLQSVETYGERSLIFIDGRFTHSVRRVPAIGDGGPKSEKATVEEVTPDAISFATQALAAAGFPTLYARVDIVRDAADRFCLMELELIEPSLFLDESPKAVDVLATAIMLRLGRSHPART